MKKTVIWLLILILSVTMMPLGISAADSGSAWVSAWSTTPVCAGLSELGVLDRLGVVSASVSSRVTITPTASGSQVRLIFSNEYGVKPLTISACTLAPTGSDSRRVDTGKLKNVTFQGKKTVTVPVGQVVTSDAVRLNVTAGEKLTVTTYFKGFNAQRTVGLIGGDTYAAVGDYTHAKSMLLGVPLQVQADSGAYEVIPSLKGIDVLASADSANCVIFGDSTVANEIPRLLAQRLRANGITNVSVTQQAVKGNRLVADGIGVAAGLLSEAGVDRFERDVLNQTGVKYVIVKLGINDLIHPHCKSKSDRLQPVTFEEMTAAYTKLVEAAHAKGVKIYLAELSPWKGYTRNLLGTGDDVQWTAEIDALRLQLNEWMAGDQCPADGYLSFPEMADPTDVYALKPAYTTDGAHLTTAGQQALVNAIPTELFR